MIASKVSFHDSTLVSLTHNGDEVSLLLDDVWWSDHTGPAAVILHGVSQVTRNSAKVQRLDMETRDAEILTLRQDNAAVTLVISWNELSSAHSNIVTYVLEGARLELLPQAS